MQAPPIVQSAASASAAAVIAGGRTAGKGAKKEAATGARAFADTTDFYADTAKRLGKAVAEQARTDAKKSEAFIRAKYAEDSAQENQSEAEPRQRLDYAEFAVGDGIDGRVEGAAHETSDTLPAPEAPPADIPLEELEHQLADGVVAETQRQTLEEILNSPDGAAFADLLDRKGISPDEIDTNPERLHAQFSAFQARERISTETSALFEEMLTQESAVVGPKQKEAVSQYIEHAVAYYPEEIVQIQETFSALDKHKAQVEEYRKQLASTESDILSKMSIYVAPETPLPANVHDIFDPGYYKQVSDISYADLDDRERTFSLALSGSKGHKGWKEPVLSWVASTITRDWPTPEEKKAIERLAYEFKADHKYPTIQERCKEELRNITALRSLKQQHDALVKEREGTASLVREQIARHMKGTEVWQVALAESAKETANIAMAILTKEPSDAKGAGKQAEILRILDATSTNLAFHLGSEMPINELREKVAERMRLMRAAELRKVLIETPITAGGFDAMFASVDALIASPEIGKHDTAKAVAHIYQSVDNIIPELPEGRAFYARTVLLKLRAKYGDMVDTTLVQPFSTTTREGEKAQTSAPSEQVHVAESPDEIIPGYMPPGMMDEEEVVPSRVEESVEMPPVREPDEVIAPETLRSNTPAHLPATIEVPHTQVEEFGEVEGSEMTAQEGVTPAPEVNAEEDTNAVRTQVAVERTTPRPEAEVSVGERMKILGPTGIIESGWVVEKVDGELNIVTLAKEGAKKRNKHSVKEVPLETLQSWQEFADRDTLDREFANAKTITELFDVFLKLRGVWEGGIFYSSDELVDKVERARLDHTNINQVPNIGKLRGIVKALFAEETANAPVLRATTEDAVDSKETSETVEKEHVPQGKRKSRDTKSIDARREEAGREYAPPPGKEVIKDVYANAAFEQYLVDIESFEALRKLLESTDHVIAGKNEFSGKYLLEQLARAEKSGATDWMPGSIDGLQECVKKLLHNRVAQH